MSLGQEYEEGDAIPVNFHAHNYLSVPANVAASSFALGSLTPVEWIHRGSATLMNRGQYTGTTDRHYRVVITDATNLQYVWSDGGAFSAPQTIAWSTWVTLSHGAEIMFAPGALTPQFLNADEGRFKGLVPNGAANLVDFNRDSEWRSAAVSIGGGVTIFINTGQLRTPKALIIADHNLPAGTNIALSASVNSNMVPLSVNQGVTWTAGHIRHVISGTHTYQYWAVTFNNLPVAMTYLRASELYLGEMITLDLPWTIGYEDRKRNTGRSPESVLMRGVGALGFKPRYLTLPFDHRRVGANQDAGKLDAVWELSNNSATNRVEPFWLHWDDVSGLEMLELCNFLSDRVWQHGFLDRMDVSVEFTSVIRTAA